MSSKRTNKALVEDSGDLPRIITDDSTDNYAKDGGPGEV